MLTHRPHLFAVALAGSGLLTLPGHAAVLTATPASFDSIAGESQSNAASGYLVDNNSPRIGNGGSNSQQQRQLLDLVVGLTLPTLPDGDVIQSATLNFRVASGRENDPQIPGLDTYLIDLADPSGTGTSLYYEAENDPNPLTAFVGGFDESQVGDGDLDGGSDETVNEDLSYTLDADALAVLQSFYTAEDPNQAEAFFRWNFDANQDLAFFNRWNIALTGTNAPALVIETEAGVIPEPASLALLGLGTLCLLGRRRA